MLFYVIVSYGEFVLVAVVLSRASIDGEKARRSLRLFIKEAWPVLEPATPMLSNWHIDCIADHLQAVFFGQITRLLVNIQPGVAKSTIFSTMWPTWCWTNDPSSRWLCASHSLDLAIRDNKNCRDLIQSEWYQERYGHLFQLKGDQNVKCLLGSTKIHTDHGELAIQDIVEQKMDVRVLTFNHVKSIIENKHILAYEKHPGRPCVQVLCSNGAKITCTLNHPFYVLGKGYVEAKYLKSGDTVYASQLRCLQERILPGTVQSTTQQEPLLQQGMLQSSHASHQTATSVRGVWEGISSSSSGRGEVSTACMQQSLSEAVGARRGAGKAYLSSMWGIHSSRQRPDKDSTQEVLWSSLSCEVVQSASRQQNSSCVQRVRKRISGVSGSSTLKILFSCLLSCTSSLENTWKGTSTLRKRVWNDVYQSAQPRWQPVYALSECRAVRGASYRSRQKEQFRSQSNYFVSVVSPEGNTLPGQVGGVEATTIIAITPDISPSFVYNLEIEDNHNYFANGILTHNSYFETDARGYRMAIGVRASGTGKRASHQLIDDPNNAMAGKADMDATIDWFKKLWLSRLNDQEHGTSVVVGQRMDEKDLSGHILSLGGWQHLCIPTEYEPARKFSTYLPGTKFDKQQTVDVQSFTDPGTSYKVVFEDGTATNCTCEARFYHPDVPCKHMQAAHAPTAVKPFWTDPRTQEGELLWPAKFPQSVLNKFKFDMGAITYAAQYQQSPTPSGGGKFQAAWFRYFLETPRSYTLEIPGQGLRSILKTSCRLFGTVDLAISEKQSADFTVFCIWSVTPDNDLLLLHVYRAHCSNAEQLEQLHKLHLYYQPDYWKIETIAYQMAFYQQALLLGIPSRPFRPDRDKERRATTAAVWSENGKAYWRKDADWLPAWEAELIIFPKGAHDDQVDNYSVAADDISAGTAPLAGDEPPDEPPPPPPTIAQLLKVDAFQWLEEHGGWA